jgi:diacylglycerol kinase (ATP)
MRSVKRGVRGGHRAGLLHGAGRMSSNPQRIALVVRPPADEERLDALRVAVSALRERGHRVRTYVTFEAGDAARFARLAARRGYEVVVAAGGDGTVNEVVNGLTRLKRPPRLAVVPLGTANDFAAGLGIPPDPGAALDVAAYGLAIDVDVPQLNGRYFINVSTGGFGAEATKEAPRAVKRWLGPAAYFVSGARKMMRMEPCHARFEVNGRTVYEGPFVFFAVGNARRTGGGTHVTPHADVDDGRLDVMILGNVSRLRLISLLPKLRAGTHLDSPHVTYLRANEIRVVSPEPFSVNADGEALTAANFHYTVGNQRLRLMLPQPPH